MKRISAIFQIVFKIFLIFLIVFVWVRYFVRSLWLALAISALVTLVIDVVTRLFSRRKQSVLALKKSECEMADDIFLTLSLSPKALDFFCTLASKRHPAEKKRDFVLITHEDGQKAILFPFLSHRNLAKDDIALIASKAQKVSATKVVVVCSDVEEAALSFAKNFECEFVILNRYDAYQKLYKPYDCFPEVKIRYKKEKGLAFKDLVKFSLNRSRAKGYFFSALVLLVSSFFVRETIYYCIVCSLLVLLALISLFNPFVRNKQTSEIL